MLLPNLDILKTLRIIYGQIQVHLKPRLSQACYASGIFTTLDILRDICPHQGIFDQFWTYSESWYSYSMPPMLYSPAHHSRQACQPLQHATHAHTNSMSFLKLTQKKGSGGLSIYKINRELTNYVTAKISVVSVKAQFSHSFVHITQKYSETKSFQKISTPENQVKLWYFTQQLVTIVELRKLFK